MPQPLQSKVATPAPAGNARPGPARAHASRFWFPVVVADRLLRQHDARLAGERALAQRQRQVSLVDGEARVTGDAFRWIYWDCVLIAVERRTHLRFRQRHSAGVAA